MRRDFERQQTVHEYGHHPMYERQVSRMTTVSAPLRKSSEQVSTHSTSTISRVGRKIKTSVKDFFGLGDEDPTESQRWRNRRARYYRGQLKDKEAFQAKDLDDDVLMDSGNLRYIHDPLRSRVRQSDISSRQTTPLSSTSTYTKGRVPMGPRKLRKDSVLGMTIKAVRSISTNRKSVRTKQHQKVVGQTSLAHEFPDDLSASMSFAQYHDDALSLVDDVFYDEPLSPDGKYDRTIKEEMINYRVWQEKHRPSEFRPTQRIMTKVFEAMDEEDKRQLGMGFVGRLLNRSYRSDRLTSYVKTQIDNIDDHRPYFTYWVTIVQILCFIVSMAVYGYAPIGTGETEYTDYVMMPNLAIEKVRYVENGNLWIGPRQADLIHLGAKYSPCMRRDEKIFLGISKDQIEEKTSGCCIRDDGSGCTQLVASLCEPTLNTFLKWNSTHPGKGGYVSGAVCGQDPNYCKDPLSVSPFEWDKNDITKWPYCKDTNKPTSKTIVTQDRHMVCEISGRPCCHGIQGECVMTTREHCNFIKGYYHEDKYLCSQVNCLSQICGMIPFSDPDSPDQFYRLWTAMFLHGGVFHLVITVGFQFLIMRDIEKLTGCIRMAIIYIGSGIAGSLASAIFLPYHVEVGPAGAQFGILACLLVEVLQNIKLLRRPCWAITKVGGFILFLFILGLLPWIDNWAHIAGFLFGFMLAFALIPYITFGTFDKRKKCIGIIFALGGAIVIFVVLIVLFYVLPLYNCPWCTYFNCIPFTSTFCKNMEVGTERDSTYSTLIS